MENVRGDLAGNKIDPFQQTSSFPPKSTSRQLVTTLGLWSETPFC